MRDDVLARPTGIPGRRSRRPGARAARHLPHGRDRARRDRPQGQAAAALGRCSARPPVPASRQHARSRARRSAFRASPAAVSACSPQRCRHLSRRSRQTDRLRPDDRSRLPRDPRREGPCSSDRARAMTTTEIRKRRTAVPHYRGVDLRLPRHPSCARPVRPRAVCGAGYGTRPVPPRSTSSAAPAASASASATPASPFFSEPTGTRRAVETHEANLGGLGYVGDLSDPAELLDHLEGWGITDVDLSRAGRLASRSRGRDAR